MDSHNPHPDTLDLHQGSETFQCLYQQLTSIQDTLKQMAGEIAILRRDVNGFADISHQVHQIERRLMVVGDVYRYDILHRQLASHQWIDADKETVTLIAAVANVADLEELSPHNIRPFSCGELQVIDRLWTTYSNVTIWF